MCKVNTIIYLAFASFAGCILLSCSSSKREAPCVDYLAAQKVGSDRWTLVNADGKEILTDKIEGQHVSPSVGGIFSVTDTEGKVHFYTATEDMRPIGGNYREAGAFTGNLAPVVCEGGWIQYVDKSGNVAFDLKMADSLGVSEAYNFHYGRARFRAANGLYGFIDEKGKVVIPAKYREAGDFCEGVAVVRGIVEDGKLRNGSKYEWAVIDLDGDERFSRSDSDVRLEDRLYYRDGLLPVSIEAEAELSVNGRGTGSSHKLKHYTVVDQNGKELSEYRVPEMSVRQVYKDFMLVSGEPMRPGLKRLFEESLDKVSYNGAFGTAKKNGNTFLFDASGKGKELPEVGAGRLFGYDVVGYDRFFYSSKMLRNFDGAPLNSSEYSEVMATYSEKVSCNYVDPEIVLASVALKQRAAGDFTLDMKPQQVVEFIHAENDLENLAGKQIIAWNKILAKGVHMQTAVAYRESAVLWQEGGQYQFADLTPRYIDVAIDFEEIGGELQEKVFEGLVKQARAWSQPVMDEDRWFTARGNDGKLAISISSLAGGIRLRLGYKVFVDLGDDSAHLNDVTEFEYDMPIDEDGNPALEGWKPVEDMGDADYGELESPPADDL